MPNGPLVCPRFQDWRIQQAASVPGKSIKLGEPRGDPVAAIQYSLFQLHYRLPKSIKANDKPDGNFGDETKQAIWDFQEHTKCSPTDGKAGRKTLASLDAAIAALPNKGGPVPGWVGSASPSGPSTTPTGFAYLPVPLA